MAWLIGIVCVVIVVYFWRIFLPLAVIAGIGLGILSLYDNIKEENLRKEALLKEEALNARVAIAKENATSADKQWEIFYEPDPANGQRIARYASIQSDDGLCSLTVQKRINGSELTGLDCPDFKISSYSDIGIKFDTDDISRKMRLEGYNDSDGVYITSQQFQSYLQYSAFIDKLSTASSLAIDIPVPVLSWVRFSLSGAADAISKLGKPEGYSPPNKISAEESLDSIKPTLGNENDTYKSALIKAEKHCKQYLPTMEMGMPKFNQCVSTMLNSMGY
jgi:hypothetical protein